MFDATETMDRKTIYLSRVALALIGAASLIWILDYGTPVFLPLVCAMVAGVVFAPMADKLEQLGAPRVVGALVVLAVILLAVAIAVYAFYPIIANFIRRVPFMWGEFQDAFSGLKATVESVERVQDKVTETLGSDSGAPAESESVAVPGIADLLAYLPSVAAQIMIFIGVLYFFLLTRADMYRLIDRNSSSLTQRTLCKAEAQVSRYFLTITAINAAFAGLVTAMLMAFQMPYAIYWGIAAFVANFILYLGPIAFAVALLTGGLVTFDGALSFAPPMIFLLMNMVEGQFVTPSLVGHHMSVNPLLVFVALVFFMWLWGPLGGIVAIPLLVWMREVNKAVKLTEADAGRPLDALPQSV